ncbi:MAG: hypothetical protein ACJ75J_10885 [Cytophagaceae bacterium]
MKHLCDFKALSLQLYGKQIEITLKENTPSSQIYKGSSLKGVLIGRVWGSQASEGEKKNTVVAISISLNDEVIQIPCEEIETLEPA